MVTKPPLTRAVARTEAGRRHPMSTTDKTDNDFKVYWPNGDTTVVNSTDLAEMPIDLAGRIAFTNMVCGWRSCAEMTMHASAGVRYRLKVVSIEKTSSGMTYATLP
jgi:hypothetical protein